MGFALTVKTKEVDESLPIGTSPYDGVRLLAIKKGAAVVSEIGDAIPVLSADTLVELNGEPLGKPVDAADAVRMLSALSGRSPVSCLRLLPHRCNNCTAERR